MPLNGTGWSYWKYGTTYTFPSAGISENYNKKYRIKIDNSLFNMIGKWYDEGHPIPNTGGVPDNDYYVKYQGPWQLQKVVNAMQKLAPTVDDFYKKIYLNEEWFVALTAEDYFWWLADVRSGNKPESINNLVFPGHHDFVKLRNFLVGNSGAYIFDANINNAHSPEVYTAWMLSTNRGDLLSNCWGKYARIACPVDVAVYDSKNVLVGRVVNNVVDDSIISDVYIDVDDDVKNVYMPSYEKYTIKLTGNNTGIMNYTIEEINLTSGETVIRKEFTDIPLFSGKEMTGTVDVAEKATLHIVEDGKNTEEIPGTVTVNNRIRLGHVSGGEKLSVTDARMVLQHLVGKITLDAEQLDIANVSGGTTLSVSDARLILQMLVGKITEFPRKS